MPETTLLGPAVDVAIHPDIDAKAPLPGGADVLVIVEGTGFPADGADADSFAANVWLGLSRAVKAPDSPPATGLASLLEPGRSRYSFTEYPDGAVGVTAQVRGLTRGPYASGAQFLTESAALAEMDADFDGGEFPSRGGLDVAGTRFDVTEAVQRFEPSISGPTLGEDVPIAKDLGEGFGAVGKAVGGAVASTTGGLFSGLGWVGVLLLVILGLVLVGAVFFALRGGIA